jgi:hypothetical protein
VELYIATAAKRTDFDATVGLAFSLEFHVTITMFEI